MNILFKFKETWLVIRWTISISVSFSKKNSSDVWSDEIRDPFNKNEDCFEKSNILLLNFFHKFKLGIVWICFITKKYSNIDKIFVMRLFKKGDKSNRGLHAWKEICLQTLLAEKGKPYEICRRMSHVH